MKSWTRAGLIAGAVGITLGIPFATAAWQNPADAATRVPSAKPAVPARDASAAASPVPVELENNMIANIRVEPVRSQTAGAWLSATGKVQFNEERTTRLLAPLPGQVVDFKLRVGDPVEKDQLVFSIKSREVASFGGKNACNDQGFVRASGGLPHCFPAGGKRSGKEQGSRRSGRRIFARAGNGPGASGEIRRTASTHPRACSLRRYCHRDSR